MTTYSSAFLGGPTLVTSLLRLPVRRPGGLLPLRPDADADDHRPDPWHCAGMSPMRRGCRSADQRPILAVYDTGSSISMGVNVWGTYDANDPRVAIGRPWCCRASFSSCFAVFIGLGEFLEQLRLLLSCACPNPSIGDRAAPPRVVSVDPAGPQLTLRRPS